MISSDPITNRQRVKRLVEKPGNGTCADCGAAGRSVWVRAVSVNASREFLSAVGDAFRCSYRHLETLVTGHHRYWLNQGLLLKTKPLFGLFFGNSSATQ